MKSLFSPLRIKIHQTMTIYNKLFNALTYKMYKTFFLDKKGRPVIKWEKKFINVINVLVFFLFTALYWSIAYNFMDYVRPKMKHFVALYGVLYVMIIVIINRPIRKNLKRNNPVKRYTKEQKNVA